MFPLPVRLDDTPPGRLQAYDCVDLDSVHNDYQRHMPYALFYPTLIKNVMSTGWAKHQATNGMIQESLSGGCMGGTDKLDHAGGRVMGDVSTTFVIEALELCKDPPPALPPPHPPAAPSAPFLMLPPPLRPFPHACMHEPTRSMRRMNSGPRCSAEPLSHLPTPCGCGVCAQMSGPTTLHF